MPFVLNRETKQVLHASTDEWMDYWRSNPNRTVRSNRSGGHLISTVFIGQDDNVFETMIFHPHDGKDAAKGIEYARTQTWDAAERVHMEALLSLEGIGGRAITCDVCARL